MKLALTAMAVLAITAAPALAQEGNFYGTVGYSNISADDLNLGGITVRGGYDFNQNFGAELEGTFGIQDDEQTVLGTPVDVELNQALGVYGVGKLPVSPQADLFARIGYVNTEISASSAGVSQDADDSAAAFGVGGQYMFQPNHGVRVGYTYLDYDDNADVFDVAYVVKF